MLSLVMEPATGERLFRFVGDRVRFSLGTAAGEPLPAGWRALLRTNLGRGRVALDNIIASYPAKPALAGAEWHDLPLRPDGALWTREIMLAEPGYFQAKAYAVDPQGRQHWPGGADAGFSVHPNAYRTGNVIYCAFARMFGASREARTTRDETLEQNLQSLEKQGFATLPPSGKLRDVRRQLPHIFDTLGCRVLHLLPVNPTPTVYARFGRYGSPYAALDLTGVDPALVEFDQRTTGVDQFCELTESVHARSGRVFLDVVINHTGWGARLQEEHPEWYLRHGDKFVCPGAWGTVWEDLAELDHSDPALWRSLAEVFLTWCRRGVDGFRCDAGYKVPVRTWRYIVARVRQEFPECMFLLEGLGGPWETTERLLTEGMMQWAYSELFQNYDGGQVASYLDYALAQSARVGVYVHYSETHDNPRLAARGRAWSVARNRLCALTSVSGGFGFTNGVEWLADERINVHRCGGLAWGNPDNILPELSRLNRLLGEHPCFFDGAVLARLSPPGSPVYALRRDSAEGLDRVLILANTDQDHVRSVVLDAMPAPGGGAFFTPALRDLLGQHCPEWIVRGDGKVEIDLPAGLVCCLASSAAPAGLAGEAYRTARARAAWALAAMHEIQPVEAWGACAWRRLADLAGAQPARFLAAVSALAAVKHGPPGSQADVCESLEAAMREESYEPVVHWQVSDATRVVLAPPGHWLLVRHDSSFQAELDFGGPGPVLRASSIPVAGGHAAWFAPRTVPGDAVLRGDFRGDGRARAAGRVRYLPAEPASGIGGAPPVAEGLVLLTNERGGMARMAVDLGRVRSKYDCLLGANLDPSLPVDRHVLAKRVRAWIIADGFATPLDGASLVAFQAGPPAEWQFVATAGDGRSVEVVLRAEMCPGRNTVRLVFDRPARAPAVGRALPAGCAVSVTLRVDIEDRNFHWETRYNAGAEAFFSSACKPLKDGRGFEFCAAPDRRLRVRASAGAYHPGPEWSLGLPHPVEASRGMAGTGDAYSPGWFELPLVCGAPVEVLAGAELGEAEPLWLSEPLSGTVSYPDDFAGRLARAARAFVVRRGTGRTVVAGYPWFLDWGRDTLIAARGLLAAGWADEVRQLLRVFGRFEDRGTLPNTIHGADASNRDTTDAPLWFGVVCEDLARGPMPGVRDMLVEGGERSIGSVLASIARYYIEGTPNGIHMDPASALVWSPGHFTWMDTNYPAGTPREGYPVEIQALWIRLLRQLDAAQAPAPGEPWAQLARRAEESLERLFWLETQGWWSDVLLAPRGVPAAQAVQDTALRSNGLWVASFGLAPAARARRCVAAAARYLLVPGAMRSLAPLPVFPPLPIRGQDGRLLNNPEAPYWGRYEGNEDTQRKPAYHNGTAWTWTLPAYCEALAVAWDWSPAAVAAARACLGSVAGLMETGCVGQIPEILDGDAPHTPRGCDAQAWSATEALRVWKLLEKAASPPT